ncbi:hypothetical protein I6N91_15400 [Arthrobacter sp. MSA 4-2]|uniref:hypothetical protein n=1 Tax=Arthrobacter sp. MSA 4-2 TaxID=2794349 RepID=UPI0018E77035|nr:hypothetical protein [Arthrobacter sp. MSA 4-2]MBJ2122367.1 hypothetical protein [Arthrobacter sp. MSA 4-2]
MQTLQGLVRLGGQSRRPGKETPIRIFLAIAGSLLVAAGILSLILDNWDVLIGMTVALAMIAVGECAAEWTYRHSEEAEKQRDGFVQSP